MTFALAFWVAVCAGWAAVHAAVGCPGLRHGPWTLETMGALKHQELAIYWSLSAGIPLLTVLLEAAARRAGRFVLLPERLRQTLTRWPSVLFIPWLGVPFWLRLWPPNFLSLVAIPLGICPFVIASAVWMSESIEWPAPEPNPSPTDVVPPPLRRPPIWVWIVSLILFWALPRTLPADLVLPSDDGLVLAAQQQREHGAMAYRDIYFQYGPGLEWVEPWIATHLLGRNWSAYRQWGLWVEPLGAMAAFFLTLFCVEYWGWALFLALVFLGRQDLLITYRVTLPFIAFAAVLATRPTRALAAWFVAGVCTAAALFHSLESGILSTASLLSFLGLLWCVPAERAVVYRKLAAYTVGWSLVGAPIFFYLGLHHAWGDFCRNTFLIGNTLLRAWGKPTPLLCEPLLGFVKYPLGIYSPANIWQRWWFPFLLYGGTIAWSVGKITKGRWRRTEDPLLLLALAGIFFGVVVMGRTDIDHWQKATAPFWVLAVLWLDRWLADIRTKRRRATPWTAFLPPVGGLILLMPLLMRPFSLRSIAEHARHPLWQMKSSSGGEGLRLGDAELADGQRQTLGRVTRAIQKVVLPGEPFYIFSDDSIFYFLTNTWNPTSYANVSFIVGDEMVREALAALVRRPPRAILVRMDHGCPSCVYYRQPMQQWIQAHYRLGEQVDSFALWIPRGVSD